MTNASSLVVLALVVLSPVAASAQEAVVTTAAPIFLMPDNQRIPLRTAAPNTRLRVLEEAPEGWIKVEFHDPQFGDRIGFIESKYVRIHRPELEPMDLSIGKERTQPAPPPARAPVKAVPPETQQPVVSPRGFARGWIDVNFGLAVPGEARYGSVFEGVMFRETATFTADYHSPAGAELDFGGGFMFTPRFGLGVSFAGTAYQDNAELGVRIPHPLAFDAHASDSTPTEGKLMRVESSTSIQAMLVSSPTDRLRVRFFGGPSFFRIRQDAVSDIIFFRRIIPNEVDITRYETEQIDFDDGGGWGFHFGGDVSIFFTRVVGIGAFARFSRGTVEVFDPFSNDDMEFQTGGFQTGGGLRLRF